MIFYIFIMVGVFRNTGGSTTLASYSNTIPTSITNLTASSSVAGQITLTWSGGLGNNVKYSYTLSSGTIQSTSGTNPTTITLTTNSATTTTVTLTASVLAGSTSATSNSITTVAPITATVTGYTSSVVNGSYTIFTYNVPGYTISNAITLTGPTSLQILAVGGGGSGGSTAGAGGGGAGGVVQSVINCTGSNDVISVYVGQGGAGAASGGNSGQSTTFTITGTDSGSSITAYGGGVGAGATAAGSGNGTVGSGGGGNGSGTSFTSGGTGTTGQGYAGANATASTNAGGGGGGAAANGSGLAGGTGVITNTATLTALSGSTFATYYWGGGGGAGYYSTTAGNGGIGGGGGGSSFNGGTSGTVGGSGITTGQSVALATIGGAGCANTGGGGGGGTNSNAGGYGGSGVLLVGLLTSYIVAPTVWSNANIPQPVLYFPFSRDMLNYASGTGVPFWYQYNGTGSVSINSSVTLNGSAGCLKSLLGTSCLMATTGFPNNSYTLPANNNGYSFSMWVRCSSNAPGGHFFCFTTASQSTANAGFQLFGPGNTGTNSYAVCNGGTTPSWNTGYSFTLNTWHHHVITVDKSGAVKWYFVPSTTAGSSITGPNTTNTTTYNSTPGFNDLRIFGAANSNGTGIGSSYTGKPYSYLNTTLGNTTSADLLMSDFYYFDAVLTLAQIQWLHSNQAIH